MQLSNPDQIEQIAKNVNFSIFELPKDSVFSEFFPNSYHITPTGKSNQIKVDQVRDILSIVNGRQKEALFIVFEQAERMQAESANTLLKSLEEPNQNIHFVFLTSNSDAIMQTIRSRANNYYLISAEKISEPPKAEGKIFGLAKQYVSASPNELPDVIEKIIKLDKDDTRNCALRVVSCGIELMYKSYLLKGNTNFLLKLEQLLATQSALQKNGHVKLQLIANML